MNQPQRELLAKTLTDLAKGIVIGFLLALGTNKVDPWVGIFTTIAAVNFYILAHHLVGGGTLHD